MIAGSWTGSPRISWRSKVIRSSVFSMAIIRNTKPIKRNAWAKKALNRSASATSRWQFKSELNLNYRKIYEQILEPRCQPPEPLHPGRAAQAQQSDQTQHQ